MGGKQQNNRFWGLSLLKVAEDFRPAGSRFMCGDTEGVWVCCLTCVGLGVLDMKKFENHGSRTYVDNKLR